MIEKHYNKLVRDKIPQIIENSGKKCDYHRATERDIPFLLYEKFSEELEEFAETPCLEEAADLYEVFLSLLRFWKIDLSDVVFAAQEKKEERGGFRAGIVLDTVFTDPIDKVRD